MNDHYEYGQKMLEDGRVAAITENGEIVAFVYFSLCNDPTPYLENVDCKFIPHDPNGTILVIENMVAGNFNFRTVSKIEEIFTSRFPNIEKGMWRRFSLPHDKIVTRMVRNHAVLKKIGGG